MGEPKISRLKKKLTTVEFWEWVNYFRVEPFGFGVLDYHLGRIGYILANQNRKPKGKVADWMLHKPQVEPETKEEKIARIQATLKAVADKYKHG